ncbi:ABC transporter permease [Dictyobacter formicarum]|uniref:ABC transporter permease n=1 Tax=Dictyobacter formicarum TaxID=2778368 RepID=A0ABQ3VF37_9CHLR|nr:ABC-2 family transporter protein [Dictyobacter formicarum]GHO84595.1 ABC transporter permease [Dictyobacter formicarum]
MHWLQTMKRMLIASLKIHMEYRLNFILFIICAAMTNLLSLCFIWVVLLRFHHIGNWSLQEVFFLFSVRLIGHGLHMIFFYNIDRISYFVRSGEFDRFLLRPLNPLFQLIIWRYNPASIGDMVTGVVSLIVASSLLHIHWTIVSTVMLILVAIGGCLIEAGLFLIVHSLSFWLTDAQRFSFMVRTFNDYFTIYPLTIYNTGLQVILTFIIPVAFIGYYPATLFLNRTGEVPFTSLLAYGTPVVGIGIFILAYCIWKLGLRYYQSTGS